MIGIVGADVAHEGQQDLGDVAVHREVFGLKSVQFLRADECVGGGRDQNIFQLIVDFLSQLSKFLYDSFYFLSPALLSLQPT